MIQGTFLATLAKLFRVPPIVNLLPQPLQFRMQYRAIMHYVILVPTAM